MKIKNIIPLLIISLILSISSVKAATYYVSSSGNDSNNGTSQSTPWQTLSKVSNFSFQPGDNILFKSGDTWYGTLNISRSGSSGNPITYSSYGSGAKPLITGFKTITGWASIGNGIYQATDPSFTSNMVNMITLNGNFQAIGRWPKVTAGNGGYLTVDSQGGTSITSSGLSSAPNFIGGQVVYRGAHWILNRGIVTSQNSSTISFTSLPGEDPYWNSAYPPNPGFGFFFQNSINALSTLGDWAYDTNSKKLSVYFGSNNPSSYQVQASTVDNLISINQDNTSYININGLTISGANSNAIYSNGYNHTNIQLNNSDISYSGKDALKLDRGGEKYFTISNNNINYTNNDAINLGFDGAESSIITNNNISDTGMVAGMGKSGDGNYNAIIGPGLNSNVSNNTITNTGYIAIQFNDKNVLVKNNFINYACMVKDDCGEVYFGRGDYTGSKILNNIILNSPGAPYGTDETEGTGEGIYADDSAFGVEIGGNTVAHSSYANLYNHGAYNLNIHDNTFYDAPGNSSYYNGPNTTTNIIQSNNIFFARTASQYTFNSGGGTVPASNFFSASDNNYFLRPINNENYIRISYPNYGIYNLDTWKTYTGKEANSKTSPIAISNTNQIFFDYNPSYNVKTVYLSGNYIDINGQAVTSPINIPAWSSVILLQSSGTNIPPVSNSVATVYKDCDYGGYSIPLPVGNYNTNTLLSLGMIDNDISSLYVSPGYQVTLYDGDNYSGSSFNITSANSCLINNNFNDKVSSIVISPITSNIPPVSNAGVDKTITLPTNSVTLNGLGSDSDGTITSYAWSKVSGSGSISSPSSATTNITGLTQGTSVYQLTVTDNKGATASDQVSVVVNNTIFGPVSAGAGSNVTLPAGTTMYTLIGYGAATAPATITKYTWTQNSGPSCIITSPNSINTTITGLTPGTYNFKLVVTDSNGTTGYDTVTVVVNSSSNLSPSANAGVDKTITLPTNSVTLNGLGSDSDGTITSYAWSKVSGSGSISSPSSATTNITGLTQGTSVYQLTVTDNKGATASDQVSVVVNNALNLSPTANAGVDKTITLPTNSVTLNGLGSDSDGTITSYAWSKVSGSGSISSPSSATTNITGLTQGTSVYQLTVTDNKGATASDQVSVVVNPIIIDNSSTSTNNTTPTTTNPNNSNSNNNNHNNGTGSTTTSNNNGNSYGNNNNPKHNYVFINTSILNVRSSPSTNSNILTKIRMGSKVEVAQVLDGWLGILGSNGAVAYISSDYTTPVNTNQDNTNGNTSTQTTNSQNTSTTDNTSPNTNTQSNNTGASPNYVTITTPILNVRSNPSTNSKVLAKINLGNRVEVVQVLNGWLGIRGSNGAIAYISSDYTTPVNTNQDNTNGNTSTQTTNSQSSIPNTSTNNPTTNNNQVSNPNNNVLPITNSNTPLTSTEKTLATLIIKNDTLNVRNNPNLSSIVLTQVHQGEKVSILQILAGWLKIRAENGMEGYISYP